MTRIKRMTSPYSVFLLIFLLFHPLMYSYDNAHFYRATNFFFGTLLAKDFLSQLDISFAGGSTHHARNHSGHKVPLFNIYGLNNMHDLGAGVPGKDLTTPEDIILTQLYLTPARDCFAQLSIDGRFGLLEANIFYTQQIACGFFFFGHIPVRRFKISDICIKDCSPTDAPLPNINTPIWQAFLNDFPEILAKYCLRTDPIDQTGVGDLTLALGWTFNYNDNPCVDFLDLTFTAGVLVPTGKRKNEDNIFSLPFGYNGHVGAPLSADLAVGFFEWLVFGAHIDAIIFAHNKHEERFETSPFQRGIINLAKDRVEEQEGTVWTAGVYTKADHFLRGISFLLGYSFARQDQSCLSNCNNCFSINNNAQQLKGWRMHTIHFALDADLTTSNECNGMHIGLFYNRIIGSQRIFNTNMLGGIIGFNLLLAF